MHGMHEQGQLSDSATIFVSIQSIDRRKSRKGKEENSAKLAAFLFEHAR